MKEIKFRAWHYQVHKMWPPKTLQELIKDKCDLDLPITLMQYTGLNDKNGVEICAGDIVRTNHGDAVVYFDKGGFRVRLRTDSYFLFHLSVDIEIIGNIHENPEILQVAA